MRKGKCRKSGLSTCRVPDVQHLVLMTRGLCHRFEQRVGGRMPSTRNVGFGDITRVRGVTDMGAEQTSMRLIRASAKRSTRADHLLYRNEVYQPRRNVQLRAIRADLQIKSRWLFRPQPRICMSKLPKPLVRCNQGVLVTPLPPLCMAGA